MNSEINEKYVDLATMIGGSTEGLKIETATSTFLKELETFVFPSDINFTKKFQERYEGLQEGFQKNIEKVQPLVTKIIQEINGRAQTLLSKEYRRLSREDSSLWKQSKEKIIGGVLACVDKGVPKEAMGVDVAVGRTFAGDTTITYASARNTFTAFESATKKRLIHQNRYDTRIPELLIEHTACGRRNQILSNEEGHPDIPSMDLIIKHLDALRSEFPETDDAITRGFEAIRNLWNGYAREGIAVKTPDGGIWIGILGKIAQRQAFRSSPQNIVPGIELYDKRNGNIFVGLDSLTALTHPEVLTEGGYTDKALETLEHEGIIFSFKTVTQSVEEKIANSTSIHKGSKTFEDLQKDWLSTRTTMVEVVKSLWNLYDQGDETIVAMANGYSEKMFANLSENAKPEGDMKRWFIHQLFHSYSYTYVLDTLTRGNPPGEHHIENHLAVGDHEIGTKSNLALGQGDVEQPATSEIFTGYAVLLHSLPGHENTPVVVMIKLDTDRPTNQSLSTEETKIALESFKAFLNLWPYFVIGDMIPVVAVRGKNHGGVDRLALSVVMSFSDIPTLETREKDPLPAFTYALNSKGEVVYIPSEKVLEVGIENKGDIESFRRELPLKADVYSDPDTQKSFIQSMQQR